MRRFLSSYIAQAFTPGRDLGGLLTSFISLKCGALNVFLTIGILTRYEPDFDTIIPSP